MSPLPSSSRRRSMGSEPAGWDTRILPGRVASPCQVPVSDRPDLHGACTESAHPGTRMSRVNSPGTADWAAHHPIGDINLMRALFGVLLVGVTALVAGAIGYQAGLSSALATTAATTGTVVYH